MTVLIGIETAVLAVLCVLVAGLLRAYGTVLRRLHQLDGGRQPGSAPRFDLLPVIARPEPAGDRFGPAHDIAGTTLDGEIVSMRIVAVEHDTVLLFLSTGCSACEVFWAELADRATLRVPTATRLLVVAQDAQAESPAVLAAMAPAGADVVLSSDAWRAYEVPGSPHVVFVDGPSGRVRGEGTGQSLRQVLELLAHSRDDAGSAADMAGVRKSSRDREQETAVDRELLAAGIRPGDPRLYGIEDAG